MDKLAQYVKKIFKQIDYRYDIGNIDNADRLNRFVSTYLFGAVKSATRGATIGVGLGTLLGGITGNVKESAVAGAQIGSISDVVQYMTRFGVHYFTKGEDGRLRIWELVDRIDV